MQTRRKGVERVCVRQLCEGHQPLFGEGSTYCKISVDLLRSKLTRKEMDLPPWSLSQERFPCAQHPGDSESLFLRFAKQIEETADAVLTHGETEVALSQSGTHTAAQPLQAGPGGSPRVTTAAVEPSALQLPLRSAGDVRWDVRRGTPFPNSRR